MEEILVNLKAGPIDTVLLIAGLVLLLPAITGFIPGRPLLSSMQRRVAGTLAAVLLSFGFALRVLVPEPQPPMHLSESASTTPPALSEPAPKATPHTAAGEPAGDEKTASEETPAEAPSPAEPAPAPPAEPGAQLEHLRKNLQSLDAENQALRQRLKELESENVKLQKDLEMHQLDRIESEIQSQDAPPRPSVSRETSGTR